MCIQARPRKCFVVFVFYTMAILENWKCYNLSHFNFDIICHFRIWCSVTFLTNWATGQTAGKLFATYLKVYHVTWFKLFFSHFRYLSKIWRHGPGYQNKVCWKYRKACYIFCTWKIGLRWRKLTDWEHILKGTQLFSG